MYTICTFALRGMARVPKLSVIKNIPLGCKYSTGR
jgi:hypothetical protein